MFLNLPQESWEQKQALCLLTALVPKVSSRHPSKQKQLLVLLGGKRGQTKLILFLPSRNRAESEHYPLAILLSHGNEMYPSTYLQRRHHAHTNDPTAPITP